MAASGPADSHPDSEELADLVRFQLDKERVKEVVKHLFRGCSRCSPQVAPLAELLLPHPPRQPPPGDGEEYEQPIERAFENARRHWQAWQAGPAPAAEELAAVSEEPAPQVTWAVP